MPLGSSIVFHPDNIIPVVVSIFLFLMYTLITLIDTNTAIREFAVGGEAVSSFKFLYSYLAGLYTYFLKLTTSLFTLYLLLTMIRVAIVVIFNIFRPVDSASSANAEALAYQGDMFSKVKEAMRNNGLWIFGLYMVERFLVFFLAYSPILFLLILVVYSAKIYNQKKIIAMDDPEKRTRVVSTLHSQTFFFLVMCILLVISYFVYLLSSSLIEGKGDLR